MNVPRDVLWQVARAVPAGAESLEPSFRSTEAKIQTCLAGVLLARADYAQLLHCPDLSLGIWSEVPLPQAQEESGHVRIRRLRGGQDS